MITLKSESRPRPLNPILPSPSLTGSAVVGSLSSMRIGASATKEEDSRPGSSLRGVEYYWEAPGRPHAHDTPLNSLPNAGFGTTARDALRPRSQPMDIETTQRIHRRPHGGLPSAGSAITERNALSYRSLAWPDVTKVIRRDDVPANSIPAASGIGTIEWDTSRSGSGSSEGFGEPDKGCQNTPEPLESYEDVLKMLRAVFSPVLSPASHALLRLTPSVENVMLVAGVPPAPPPAPPRGYLTFSDYAMSDDDGGAYQRWVRAQETSLRKAGACSYIGFVCNRGRLEPPPTYYYCSVAGILEDWPSVYPFHKMVVCGGCGGAYNAAYSGAHPSLWRFDEGETPDKFTMDVDWSGTGIMVG